MAAAADRRIALLVTSAPYYGREPRAEADMALAAAALDIPVNVYFIGDAILQLAESKQGGGALLPAGYKAWTAAPDLGTVRFFAESGWLARCERLGIALAPQPEGMGFVRMKNHWRGCSQVLVL